MSTPGALRVVQLIQEHVGILVPADMRKKEKELLAQIIDAETGLADLLKSAKLIQKGIDESARDNSDPFKNKNFRAGIKGQRTAIAEAEK